MKSIENETLKPSNGFINAYASSRSTLTSFKTFINFFFSSWSAIPAAWRRKTKGPALPSMIGISGPSTSIRQLSMPSPAIADKRCSIVDILCSPDPSVVDNVVKPTSLAVA